MKLYVGCALASGTSQNKAAVDSFKRMLRAAHLEVLEFAGSEGEPTDVERIDIGNIRDCDAFIAIADEPSTGLGIEIGVAAYAELKPVLVLVHEDVGNLSRLAAGVAANHQRVTLHRYEYLAMDALEGVPGDGFVLTMNWLRTL